MITLKSLSRTSLPQSRQDEDYRDFELSQNVQAYT